MVFHMLFDLLMLLPELQGTAFYFVCGVMGYIAAKQVKRNVAVRLRSGKGFASKEDRSASKSEASNENQEEDAPEAQVDDAPSSPPTHDTDFDATMEMLWADMKEACREQEKEDDEDLWEPMMDFEREDSDKSDAADTDGSGVSTTEVVGEWQQPDGVESEEATDNSGETCSDATLQESSLESHQPAASDEVESESTENSEGSEEVEEEETAGELQHQACDEPKAEEAFEESEHAEPADESQHQVCEKPKEAEEESTSESAADDSRDNRSRHNWFDTTLQEEHVDTSWLLAKAESNCSVVADEQDDWAEAEADSGPQWAPQAEQAPINDGWMQPWDDFMGDGQMQAPCYMHQQPQQLMQASQQMQPEQWVPDQPFVEYVPMLMKVDPNAEDLDPSFYRKVHPEMEVYAMSHVVNQIEETMVMTSNAALEPMAPPMMFDGAWDMPWEG